MVAARAKYEDFVRTTYMSSPVTGTAGALLTASDPESLLQHSDYLNYTADHQLDAIGQLSTRPPSPSPTPTPPPAPPSSPNSRPPRRPAR